MRTAKERDVKEFDWTRKGPLPAAEPAQRRVPDRSAFGRNMDAGSDAGSDRPPRRNFESDGKPRDFGNWERKGPLSPVSGGAGAGAGGPPREGRRASPAWGEGRGQGSQDGSRPPRREPAPERTPTAAELDNSWRSRMRPDPPAGSKEQPSAPPSPATASATPASPASPAASTATAAGAGAGGAPAAAPATRPRLNLQKRTVADNASSPSAGTESKASPFGGARPIDTATRERQVEERRQVSLRQKKEADDKARAEKNEKQRATKDQTKAEKQADPNGKDSADIPQGGKNFDILRRATEEEGGMAADQDPAEEAAAAAAASKTEASEASAQANGAGEPAEGAAAGGDDEGWSTVGTKQRNNRRGQTGRSFA